MKGRTKMVHGQLVHISENTFRIESDFNLRLIKWLVAEHSMTIKQIAEEAGISVATLKRVTEEGYRSCACNDAIRTLVETILNGEREPIDFQDAVNRRRNRVLS